jgi:CTP synthase (UTP-ammonia lyase)
MPATVAILGEYNPKFHPHVATDAAIRDSCAALGVGIDSHWVSTADVDDGLIRSHQGVLVAPGSPYKNMARTLEAIRYAREHALPCLGTCGGFQHMIIEYARNALGYREAQHAEYDPYASNLFVTKLDCSLVGRDLEVRLAPGSFVAMCYGVDCATESYYCNFGVPPDKVAMIAAGDLKIVGSDNEGEVRVVELPGHPFFVGTLFVPQLRSTPARPHPLVNAFIRAVSNR